jgi:4-aminobutyrate aminotransferase-like enzyme
MENDIPAASLSNNPNVVQGKQLLLTALNEERKTITGMKPADPALKAFYSAALKEFADLRGMPLRYPYIGSGRGNGVFVELLDGSVKYDFISGIGVYAMGHCNPDLAAASMDAALSNTLIQGNLQQNSDSLELHRLLRDSSQLPHSILSTSGAMAVENALKLAFQKKAPAQRVLAFEHCFAGRTLALSQMTDKPAFRDGLPPTITVDYIPFFNQERPEESIQHAEAVLRSYLSRYPKGYAAMVFELVQGEGGIYSGSEVFFKTLMRVLKEFNVAIIVDEVQTFGRTPQLFAFQHFQLQEYVDICTIGKLSLVCATLFKSEYIPRPGLISQTFTSTTAAIRSAIVIIQMLLKGGFYGANGRVEKLYQRFLNQFTAIEKRNPTLIRGPYGIGGMLAFTPYNGDNNRVMRFSDSLFEAGVISFTAGGNPTRVRLLPPFGVMTEDDIDQVCMIIEKTLVG